jgi:hypothetical protein
MPGSDFKPVQPDLEDVYFTTMAGHYVNGFAKRQEKAA